MSFAGEMENGACTDTMYLGIVKSNLHSSCHNGEEYFLSFMVV